MMFNKKIIVLLCALISIMGVGNDDVKRLTDQLNRMHISSEFNKDANWIIASIADAPNKVIINPQTQMNSQKKVIRNICCLFGPYYLTSNEFEKLSQENQKTKIGHWGALEYDNTKALIIGCVAEISASASDDELASMIIHFSQVKVPFFIDRSTQYKCAIIDVLTQDQKPPSKEPREIVRHMNNINLSLCPKDFADAYNAHINAWRKTTDTSGMEAAAMLGGIAGSNNGTDRSGAAAGLVIGALAGAVAQANVASDAIRSTFSNVLQIARSYGVDTSSYK